jgi:hypothetical protein
MTHPQPARTPLWPTVAALGFTMARLWRQERAAAEAATGQPTTELPPEQHFPGP